MSRLSIKRNKCLILKRICVCIIWCTMFPFFVLMQTVIFCTYTAQWSIDKHGLSHVLDNATRYRIFLLDFLYPLFPRSAVGATVGQRLLDTSQSSNLDEFATVDWFFRQTMSEKLFRILLSFVLLVLATMVCYNVAYFFILENETTNVSNMESLGCIIWFGILWILLSMWYGHTVISQPTVDSLFSSDERESMPLKFRIRVWSTIDEDDHDISSKNVRSKFNGFYNDAVLPKLHGFNKAELFCEKKNNSKDNDDEKKFKPIKYGWRVDTRESTVDIFLSSLKFDQRKLPPTSVLTIFIGVSLFYSLIPSIVRISQKSHFFGGDEWFDTDCNTVIRGWILNFILIFATQYLFEMALHRYFRDYRKLMTLITELIEIPSDYSDDDEIEKNQLFLSFDDPINLLSWFEIRSYGYAKGRELFAQLELFITFFTLILIIDAVDISVSLFLNQGIRSTNRTILGIFFIFIINFGWLVRLFMLGMKFDQLQTRQEKAMMNQISCIQSEALTCAYCTGPIGWIEFKLGTWDRLYKWLHDHRQQAMQAENHEKNIDFDHVDDSSEDNGSDGSADSEESLLKHVFDEMDSGDGSDIKQMLKSKLKEKFRLKWKEKRKKMKNQTTMNLENYVKKITMKKEQILGIKKEQQSGSQEKYQELQELKDEFDQY